MSSSILAGERRWVPGPARRGGMTVLGKVVVPKPLNLPSQRLENHGLDPNVEIVPKGSLSWGSRSSSSASNPWGSSALSPNADGASGSPSHLSGRPSSGSGTRPSTAGSDKKSEPTAIAWGPNSRPSSASGASTGNQTSLTSLRPHSADTRPGSSPLSRFAEPSSDNAGAWGSTGTVDKLVVASSKNDGFSLSSGDFPTLGSDKDNVDKNSESQDHGSHSRPGSSSGRVVHAREMAISPQADVSSGNVNAWKRDGSQHVDDVGHPKADKWQGDPQQYMNPNRPPQQFDSWHGPPMNAPPGVWYGGPPGGPPYPPVAHGRFPMEPFPYYRPQFSAPPSMVNSQSVPHPGAAGPRGHHPQNVDLYRPHAPDAYIRPGMPIRPGFFPGPVAYESYYGPPMGYNEKDMPFMGMAGGPPVHGRYLAQNTPDAGNNHARSGWRGPAVKQFVPEQVDSGHPEEPRGPYKVLMKQHNEWGGKAEEDNWEQFEKGDHPRRVLQKNEWGTDNRRDEELFSRMTPGENLPKQGGFAVKSVEGKDKTKVVDDGAGRKSEVAAISSQEVPRPRPTTPKDPTLIQKIEGLNAKARGTDGRQDAAWGSGREEQKNRLHVDAKASNSTNEVTAQTMKDSIPAKSTAATRVVAVPRRSCNVTESRVDDRGKARDNNQDADAWRKKHQVADPSRSVPAANFGHGSRVIALDHPSPVETDEKSEIDLPRKDEEGMFDPNDCHAQRVKMRELAKQRAIQLQKEEEERIKEQKAKALAKLEELNRRTKAADGSTHKLEKAPPSDTPQHEQVVLPVDEQLLPNTKEEPLSSALAPTLNFSAHISDKCSRGVVESTVLPRDTNLETPKNAETPAILHGRSLPLKPDVLNSTVADTAAPPQVTDANVLKQKRMGYKQKQNNTQVEKQNNAQVEKQNHAQVEKNTTQNVIEVGRIEVPKGRCSTAVNAVEFIKVVPSEIVASSEPSLPDGSQVMPDSSSNQRKKNNRSSKSKPKLDDTSHLPASQQQAPNESNPVKASNGKPKVAPDQSALDTISVQPVTGTKDLPVQSSELQAPLLSEEAHGRGNHQLKPQQSRRVQRNQQAVRPAGNGEAVVWAPVRSQNKMEALDEATPKNAAEMVVTTAAGKSDELGQSNVKSKRAEMERYVPKPAAKEQLSQQGSAQQQPMHSSITPTGRAESSFQVKTGGSSDLEAKNGDNKQMKQQHQVKSHGAWRQRGSVESARVQGSSFAPHSGKNVRKFMDQHESSEPVTEPVREEEQQLQQPMAAGEWNDGWHMPDEPPPVVAAPVTYSVKDQGAVAGRGKRYPHKGQRNNQDHDQRNSVGWENEINQQDTVLASKENRGTGEQKPTQWQAKPHGNYQRGGGSSGTKKDFPPLQQDKESNVPTQFVSENKYAGKTPNVAEHQDGRRERKTVDSSKGRPQSPNVGFVEGATEEAFSSNQTGQQQFSSGFRKNGNQNNNRSVRGHESRGEWSSGGQDNKPHNMPPPNRERRRQNAHYEYQPVGSYNNNKSNNFDGPRDGSHNFGSRYRERSMGQDGRNSYGGQQSGTVQADSGNDWQE